MNKKWKIEGNNAELRIGPFLLNVNQWGIMGELLHRNEFDFDWAYPGTTKAKCEEAEANLKRTLLAILKELE